MAALTNPAPRQPEPNNMLSLVQSSSLAHLVAEAVEKLILTGELAAGSKLNEAQLAERFGVSRGPLREAFRLLEESGLVRQEKNRGAYVRQVEVDEAIEIYEVRAGLDSTAGRLLAPIITPQQVAELRVFTDAMLRAGQTNDGALFHGLNLQFHDLLIEMTGNRCLIETYRRIIKLLTLFRRRILAVPHAIPEFAGEHSAIVDALARGDGDRAAALLFAHAQGGLQRLRVVQSMAVNGDAGGL